MIAITRDYNLAVVSRPKRQFRADLGHDDKRMLRDRAIFSLHADKKWSTFELAHAFGLSQRSVQMIIGEIKRHLERLADEP